MFREAAVSVLVAVLAIIVADIAARAVWFRHKLHVAGTARTASVFLRHLRIAVNVAGFACFAAAAASGLGSLLQRQDTLSGYVLLVHVAAAAAFALTSVAIALFWTGRNRFTASDWRCSYRLALRKIFFWLALALAVPTIVSIVLAMFPLPTPSQQQSLFLVHRFCALALAAAGTLFVWFALMNWRDQTPE
jgi:hypothetical protein